MGFGRALPSTLLCQAFLQVGIRGAETALEDTIVRDSVGFLVRYALIRDRHT